MKKVLRIISLLGLLLFGGLFAVIIYDSSALEKAVQVGSFIPCG